MIRGNDDDDDDDHHDNVGGCGGDGKGVILTFDYTMQCSGQSLLNQNKINIIRIAGRFLWYTTKPRKIFFRIRMQNDLTEPSTVDANALVFMCVCECARQLIDQTSARQRQKHKMWMENHYYAIKSCHMNDTAEIFTHSSFTHTREDSTKTERKNGERVEQNCFVLVEYQTVSCWERVASSSDTIDWLWVQSAMQYYQYYWRMHRMGESVRHTRRRLLEICHELE